MTVQSANDRTEWALTRSLVGRVGSDARRRMTAGAIMLDVPAGAVFYRDEDPPRLALVVAGLVRVFLTSPDGRQVTIRYARRGEILGVPTAIAGPVDVSVQALTDCSMLMFNVDAVRAVATSDPVVAWAFAEEVSRRLYDVLAAFAGDVFGSVRQRVARHLLDLAADQQQGRVLVATVSQQALADAAGTAREVVTRTLHDLRQAGLIETARSHVTILDVDRLTDLVATGEL